MYVSPAKPKFPSSASRRPLVSGSWSECRRTEPAIRRQDLRTRRLAAALAAVLALSGVSSAAQAQSGTSDRPDGQDTSVLAYLWAQAQRWCEELGEESDGVSIQGEEGGSDDPESGDPGYLR